MKTLYLVLLVCFLYSCNKTIEVDNYVITPDNFIPRKIKLSEFAQEIAYIPLSNQNPISHIYTIQSIGDKFCLGINPQQILIFDHQGNFVQKIGKSGRGPSEYQYSFLFTVDNENKQIFVLNKTKILVFSDTGTFERDIDISKFNTNFDAITYNNEHLYLFENIKFGQAKYNWVVIDKQGNELSSKLNTIPKFKSRSAELINMVFKTNNHFCYWNSLNDSIFDVYPSKYKSRYQFAQNNYRVNHENIGDMHLYSKRIFIPKGFWESKQYLFFNYHMESKSGFGLLDKATQTISCLEQGKDKKDYKGYINDFDAGPNFVPTNYLTINDEEYLIGSIPAYKLNSHIKSSAFQVVMPEFPNKKKDLEELANSLNENDNPVLMLVKLKD